VAIARSHARKSKPIATKTSIAANLKGSLEPLLRKCRDAKWDKMQDHLSQNINFWNESFRLMLMMMQTVAQRNDEQTARTPTSWSLNTSKSDGERGIGNLGSNERSRSR
jgi:hypothetical protein